MWSRRGDGESRPFGEVAQEAFDVLRQDAGEYGYIAALGAVPAAVAVAIGAYIGGPVAMALVGPAIVLGAALTLAVAAAALDDGASNLQPDSARAALRVLTRAPAVLLPWLPLAVGLWTAAYAVLSFGDALRHVPGLAVVLALAVVSALYAVPRVMQATALFAEELSWRQAERSSAAVVRAGSRHVALSVTLCALPAEAVAALAIVTGGFDAATAALVTLFLVGAMPALASLLATIYAEAAERLSYEAGPSRAGTATSSVEVIGRAMGRRA